MHRPSWRRSVVVSLLSALVGCARLGPPSATATSTPSVATAASAVTGSAVTASAGPTSGRVDPAPGSAPGTASQVGATTTVDPGASPQTKDRPSGTDPAFLASMDLLWSAITSDAPAAALPAFFPLSAYRQVKAIAAPDRDYTGRLVAHFRTDVHDEHTLLGADAARAQLVAVTVPDAQAVWVGLGQEQNKVSYWRVYGTLLHYRLDGRDGTLPVTSLISWRGRWYVVHLGRIR